MRPLFLCALGKSYFRIGAPLTIITLAIGTLWLWL